MYFRFRKAFQNSEFHQILQLQKPHIQCLITIHLTDIAISYRALQGGNFLMIIMIFTK